MAALNNPNLALFHLSSLGRVHQTFLILKKAFQWFHLCFYVIDAMLIYLPEMCFKHYKPSSGLKSETKVEW